jgi:3-oxoadipate enol-lactonase
MPTPWDLLRPIAEALVQRGRRVLIAALPGYGPNASSRAFDDTSELAAAFEGALAEAQGERFGIVGFSSGAYHALNLAVRGRVAVDSLVLFGAYAAPTPEEPEALRGFARALRENVPLAGVPTARFLAPAFAQSHPAACERVEAWLHQTSPDNLARELEAIAAAPLLLDRAAAFQGTLLARTGALDLATPPYHAQAIARAVPRGRAEIVPYCAHALLEEDRDGTIAAALAALS